MLTSRYLTTAAEFGFEELVLVGLWALPELPLPTFAALYGAAVIVYVLV